MLNCFVVLHIAFLLLFKDKSALKRLTPTDKNTVVQSSYHSLYNFITSIFISFLYSKIRAFPNFCFFVFNLISSVISGYKIFFM